MLRARLSKKGASQQSLYSEEPPMDVILSRSYQRISYCEIGFFLQYLE